MKQKITKSLLTFLMLLVGYVAFAQDGSNDPTFNPIDDGALNGLNALVADAIYQPDGKIIVSGTFTKFGLTSTNYIARLNADGSLDASFTSGAGSIDGGYIASTALQPDGKIVAGGAFTVYDGTAAGNITRLAANGGLDNTFNTGSGADGLIEKVVLQPDGKIIVVGAFTSFNGQPANRIVRLNSDGSIDTSFQTGSGANSQIRDVLLQPDGKIVASGSFTTFNTLNKRRVVRLNTNGSVDTTFTAVYPDYATAFAIALQSDGKIYVGQSSSVTAKGVYRLNSNGSLDSSFVFDNSLSSIVLFLKLQQDQKLLVGSTGALIRINSDGNLDGTFAIGQQNGVIDAIALTGNGKILTGGWFTQYNDSAKPYLIMLNADGTEDVSFDGSNTTGASEQVYSIIAQPEGKFIITGSFNHYNNIARRGIARLNENGDLDESYAIGTGTNAGVDVASATTDGKMIIGGRFSIFNGSAVNGLARINADGSLDTTFNVGPFTDIFGGPAGFTALSVLNDGKILVAGSFSSYSGTPVFKICRLNSDGSLDASFSLNVLSEDLNNDVTHIIELPDASILIASMTSPTGTQPTLFKVNTSGTLINSFTPVNNSQVREIYSLAVQPDGKILVSGGLSVSSTITRKLFRINSDGSPDSSFQFPILQSNSVSIEALHPQENGKIIIAGAFGTGNTTMQSTNIARLNADGSQDLTFNPGQSANGVVNSILAQQDKLVIAGNFTTYDGSIRGRLARVNATGTLASKAPVSNANQVIVFRDNGNVNVNSSVQPVKSVKIFDLSGRLIAQKNNINELSASVEKMLQNNAILIVKVELNDGSLTTKKIY